MFGIYTDKAVGNYTDRVCRKKYRQAVKKSVQTFFNWFTRFGFIPDMTALLKQVGMCA